MAAGFGGFCLAVFLTTGIFTKNAFEHIFKTFFRHRASFCLHPIPLGCICQVDKMVYDNSQDENIRH